MSTYARFLNPAEAATRLGVSTKALRLYEARGLLTPVRTGAGWRAYGADEMARAAEIVALRALGLGLAEIKRVLSDDRRAVESALAAHQESLGERIRELGVAIEKVHRLRADLTRRPEAKKGVAFALPWPWAGECFELSDLRSLSYIIGPLGSGKTRLAMRLAEALPGAAFVGLDRLDDDAAAARARLDADPDLATRVTRHVTSLVARGAKRSGPLIALLAALEADGPTGLVVDMVEDGLDHATQVALIAHLRDRVGRPLFLMTRSSSILDLGLVGTDEAIIFCPANHSPPMCVTPCPGTPGYEAAASCLGSPEVRARTRG